MKKLLLLSVMFFVFRCASGSQSPLTPFDVVIDHEAGTISPANVLRKKDGEIVKIHVVNTDLDCYEFNATTIELAPEVRRRRNAASDDTPDDLVIEALYEGVPTKLQVSAVRRGDDDCGLSEHRTGGKFPPWEVLVKTDGWDLAFGGAFVADGLTNPRFEALPATRPTAGGGTETGVKVSEVEGGRDEARLGAAATVHLYHTDPEKIGLWNVNWVPVSFGLGVGENSQTRYYLGTGIKFDRKLFLTAGMALGAVQRPPTGLDENNFTTNTNILSNLPTRVERTWFAGISYTFAGVGPDAFRGPFATVAPAPQVPAGATGTSSGGTSSEKALAVEDVHKGDSSTYTIVVTNFTADEKDFRLKHDVPTGATNMTWRCDPSGGVQCPGTSETADQTGKIDATVKLGERDTVRFTVKTVFPAGQASNGKAELSGGATETKDIILK